MPVAAPQALARGWLQRLLWLAAELLEAAQVPLFGPATVLDCLPVDAASPVKNPARPAPAAPAESVTAAAAARGGETWQARIALPAMALQQPAAYRAALEAALRTLAWMHEQQADPARDPGLFFDWLEAQVLVALRRHAPSGKSTPHVLRACHQRGLPVLPLGGGIYQLGWGAKARRFDRSTTDRDSAMGMRIAQDKGLTARLLRAAGLPGARHELVREVAAAQAAAQRLGWPVVVKPADSDRGEGVTVDVGPDALALAFEAALKRSTGRLVLVERQAEGVCHRLFIAGGRLLYAVKRLPAGVYGDGSRTVAALVADALAVAQRLPPWRRERRHPLDELAQAELQRQGLTAASVPAAGRFVALRRIESTQWGGVDEEVTSILHPHNLKLALDAAALCGLDVAGIDLICRDISRPWHEQDAIINEVNYAPLLGGGEISRSHLPEYVARLAGEDWRIPVEVFVGDDEAFAAARARQQTLRSQGLTVALTGDQRSLGPDGEALALTAEGLYGRTRALLLHPWLEALILVVQTDELLDRGVPLDRVDALHIVNHNIASRQPDQDPGRRRLLLQRLALWSGQRN